MRRSSVVWSSLAIAAVAAIAVLPARPDDKSAGRKIDLMWTDPGFATRAVRSIAFMPAVSFTNDVHCEKLVEDAAAAAIKGIHYRWLSPRSALAMLKATPAADSLWQVERKALLRAPRVDSLAAPLLCRALRTNALLTFRVDQFEQHDLGQGDSGKPTTVVEVRAAMVDSSGRLLWTGSGSEVGEGALQDADQGGFTGVNSSGLTNTLVTGTGKAPAFEDVLDKLFARWAPRFPVPPAPAPAPASTP